MSTATKKRIVDRFEKAVEARAFKGSQPPGDWESIEREYRRARAELIRVVIPEE